MEEGLRQLTIGKALLIGIGIVAFYYFMMYDSGESREKNIITLQGEISQKQAELTKVQGIIAEAKKVEVLAKNLEQSIEQVRQAAPENFNSLELMKILSSEAKVVGANIVSLNAAGTQVQDKTEVFTPVKVTVQLESTYNQLMLFLSNLTKTSRIIISSKINLNMKNAQTALETASPILTFSGEFTAYKYNPNTEAAANAQ